ncbi:MAG: glycosyltransferase family 39 protein [Lysobacteraceae bacterium]
MSIAAVHPSSPKPLSPKARRELLWFATLAVLLLAAGLGLRDPWPADEPRFALVAQQMVASGDWLFPHRGIELYPDKPPLFMWCQAALLWLGLPLRIAFLLPSLIAALGTLWLTWDLGRRLWTHRVGLYAATALLFALQFTFQMKRAQIDPLLCFWMTLSMYGFLRHLLRGPSFGWWSVGFFAGGLGVITKGVGVLTLLVLLPAAFAAWRGWPGMRFHRGGLHVVAPLLLLLAIALWLAPMLLVALGGSDPLYREYVDNILFKQTAERYANAWHHHKPWWYFGEVIALQWLPASLALPWAAPAWWRRLKRRDPRYLLPLGWFALLLLFFSLSPGKREVYILPALPMFCLALGPLLPGLLKRRGLHRAGFVFSTLLTGLTLLLAAALFTQQPKLMETLGERGVDDQATLLAWLCLVIAAGAIAALACFRWRRGWWSSLAVLGWFWLVVGVGFQPVLNDSSSARGLMRDVAEHIGPDAELGLVAWKEQNLLMADRPATDFGFRQPVAEQRARAADWLRAAPADRWVLSQRSALGDCVDETGTVDLGEANRRDWLLYRAEALRPTIDCPD